MNIQINTFAALKGYFSQSFVLNIDTVRTIEELKKELIRTKPSAEAMINSCRFAVDETFVNDTAELYDNVSIYIIPPSSGG